MTKRLHNQKIPDIKVIRSLTRLLGKLHIPSCYRSYQDIFHEYDDNGQFVRSYLIWKEEYGLGLKESKDYVESKYEYVLPQETYNPRREIERGNMIHEIKRTRQLMSILSRFGIASADAALRPCKDYVTRRRS